MKGYKVGNKLICNFTGLLRCKLNQVYEIDAVNKSSIHLKGIDCYFYEDDMQWFDRK